MLAPVRASLLWSVAVVVLFLAATACSPDAEERQPAAAERAAAEGTQTAPGRGAPFDLRIEDIAIVGMDNAEILGAPGAPTSHAAAEHAVTAARDALRAFLNAQLVADETRFSAGPIDELLSARARTAVTAEDRAGLGQLDLAVDRTVTGPASALAQVLVHGEDVAAVTLSFNVLLTVVLEDGTDVAAKQSGAMTFVPTDEGWRADGVEVTTELPGTEG